MIKNKQADIIKNLNQKEILLNLYLTQFLFLLSAFIISYFFYRDIFYFSNYLTFYPKDILVIGGLSSFIVIILDVMMWKYVPKHLIDDGGINEKIFSSLPIVQILILTLIISICEEILFRGTLQPKVGLIWTSIGFAVMHIRYLSKFVLLVSVLGVSFFLGWLFEITENLYVTIFAHFLIDFILGVILRLKLFPFIKND
jgi:uncharacterized protein